MIGKLLKGVFGFFSSPVAGQVIGAVDRLNYSAQERGQDDQKYTGQAMQSQFAAPIARTSWDVLIDVVSRLPRPYITFWLVGGFSGWWQLPNPESVHPFWLNIFYLVITFWFGGRALFKDLPKAVGAIMQAWKGRG